MTTDSNIDLSALACQCPACSGQFGQDDAPVPAAGLDTDQLSDQINTGNPDTSAVIHTNGLKWGSSSFGSGATVSYSFLSSVPSYYSSLVSKYGIDYPSSFIGFSTAQKNATREILSMYSDVANISFVETSGVGTLTFANHSMGSGVGAYAYYPNLQRIFPSDTAPLSGDVWINNTNRGTSQGSWGYLTLIHEIGHAIGLKHPGNYNAGGGGTDGPYLPSSKDNHQHTVMSYHDHPNHPSTSPVSPLLFDIAAVQYLYGVNNSTRTGNDTYTVNYYGEIKAIWDAGGNDTLSAAGTSRNATIRLDDGEFSSINGTNNIAIAYGAVIENATGGSGHDYLYGTSGSNRLDGGSGTDRLYGRSGDDTLIGGSSTDYLYGENGNDVLEGGADGDTLYGGSGDDTAVFSGSSSSYTIDDFGTYFRVTDLQGNRDGIDTLFDVEFARFQDGTVSLNGPELVLNSASVFENSVAGTLVGMITLDPPQSVESFTFALTNSAGGLFAINAISGAITTTQVLDHETIASADLGVRATGSNATVVNQPFTIAIVDVNEAPEDIDDTPAFVIAEDAGIGDSIGTIIVDDPDAGDSHTFELTDDAGGLFSIDAATGEILVAGELDFETAASHQITIKGTDSGGLSNEWTRTVTVNDVNEAPETDGHNVVMAQGAVASAQLTATDDDGDAVTFSLSEGAANGTVTLGSDGNYTYVADDGFTGDDSFTVLLSDGLVSTFGTVNVSVIEDGKIIKGQTTPGEPITIDTDLSATSFRYVSGLQLVDSGNGYSSAFWTIGDEVQLQIIDASGRATGQVRTVASVQEPTESIITSTTAVPVSGGGSLVSWITIPVGSSTQSETLTAQFVDAAGQNSGEPFVVASSNTLRINLSGDAMAQLDDGSFIFAWSEKVGNENYGINGRRYSEDGNALTEKFVLTNPTAEFRNETEVAPLTGGGFAVVSSYQDFSPIEKGASVQLFNADGSAKSSQVDFISDIEAASDTNIASMSDGGVVAAWLQGTSLFVQRFDGNGNQLFGDPRLVADSVFTAAFDSKVDLIGLPDGGFAISWPVASDTQYHTHAVFQKFDVNGFAAAAPALISTDDNFNESSPRLSVNSNGNLVASWVEVDGYYDRTPVFRVLESEIEGEVEGISADEILFANDSGNTVDGQGGDDTLQGGAGADTLIGGDGNDVLIGGGDSNGSSDGLNPASITTEGPETLIETPSSDFALGQTSDVAVAGDILALPDGGYIVVWAGTARSDDVDLAFQRYDADGNEVGDEVIVDSALVSPTDAQNLPRLLGFEDGGFLLAWASTSPSQYAVNAQRFDQNANATGPELVLYERAPQAGEGTFPTNAQDIALVGQADGGFGLVVTMRTSNPFTTGNGIELLTFDSAGDLQQRTHVPQDQEKSHFDIRSSALADGSMVASWAFGDPVLGNVEGVAFRRFGADGLPLGDETVVNTAGANLLSSTQIVGLSDGRFAVLWHVDQGASGETRVSFFSSNGQSDGASVLLPQLHFPTEQMVASPDGGFVIVNGVLENGSHVDPQNLIATQYDGSGSQIGDTVTLTETTGSLLEFPRVELLASGELVVVWTDSDGAGGGLGQYQRRLSFDDGPAAGDDVLIGGAGDDILIGDSVNDSSLPDSVTPTSDETVVDTTYDTSIGQSNILALPDGGYVLITATDDPDSGISEDIVFQRYNAQGEEVGGEVIVNTSRDGIQTFQHAVVLSDGSFLIAWFDLKESDSFFRAQRFDGNGDPIGSELILDEQLSAPGSFADEDVLTGLVALSNGGFAVVSDDVGPGFFRTIDETPNTKLLVFDNAGQLVSETPIADNQDQSQSNSVATSLADGSFVIAWNEQLFPASGNDGISFRRYSSVGEPLGEETVVLEPGTEQGFNPLIVALTGGGFAILWDDFSSGSESFVQIFSATGEATTGIVPIGNFYIADAEVEPTAEGGFVVYHSVHVNGDLQGDVYYLAADQFDADGNQVGGQTILNEAFSYDGYHATEVLKSGEHVVALGSADIPGHGNGLVQLRVSTEIAEGPPSSFGNDTLIGGAGDDIIDGGGGDDIAVFEGRVLDYTITEDGADLIVRDGVSGRDGTDILTNVERARFADGDFTLDGAAQLAVSETTVDEDVAAGGEVATVGAVFGKAGEAFTFELTDDAGGALSIDAATGVIITTTGLDHETAPTLDISVRATGDQGTIIDKDVTITVADVNEAPADTDDTAPLVIAEDAGIGDAIGTIVVSDPDAGDSHTFELLDDAGGLFAIDAQTGVVSVAGALDHETADSLTITVQATDSGGLSNQWVHTISVTDVNEAPDGGGALAIAGTEDNDVSFSRVQFEALFSDQDAGDSLQSIRVDTLPTGGTLLLAGAAVSAGTIIDAGDLDGLVFRPDADVNGIIGFAVSFGDGDLFSTAATTVTVALDAVNDAPVNIDLTPARVLEGSAAGTVAATVDAIDVDAGDTHTFSLDDNAGGLFEIDATSGVITVTRDITLAETGAHDITVRAVDAGGLENTWTRTVTLDGDETILAGNEAEAIDGGTGIDTVDYSGSSSGVTVDLETGTGSGSDAAGDTFVRVENVTGSAFADTLTGDDGSNVIAGGAGADTLNAGAGNDLYSFNVGDGADSVHDFTSHDETRTESQAYTAYRTAYRTVTVTSGEGNTTTNRIAYQQAYTAYRDIQITESFQDDGGVDALAFGAGIARSDILVRLDGADLLVGIKDTDNPGTDLADLSDVIRITDWTNELSRVESLRFAAGNTVALTALLDSGALADGATLDLATVQDDVVTAVGTNGADRITGFSGDDALSGGAGADEIEGGGGNDSVDGGEGDDVAVFAGAEAGYSVDYNDDGSLTVTDTDASDGDDGSDTLTGIETIRFADGDVDVNDAPVDIDGTAALSVSESAAPGDAVGTIVVTDPDADDTHTFDLVDDAGGLFSIDAATGVVSVAASLDFETASSHEITVRATDSGGLSNTWTRSITVGDANDAPEVTETLSASGPENTDIALGRSRFETVFQDQDAGDTLVSVRIDTVPSLGQLKLGGVDVQAGDVIAAGDLDTLVYLPVTDFGGDISFTFSVSDGEAFSSAPTPFEISVFAVNDAPDGILIDNTSVSESAAAGAVVGTAVASDPDPFDTHSYSLTDDAGGLFSIDAATGEITVAGDLDFEAASQHDITIRVEDAGGLSTDVTQTITVSDANDAPTAEGAVALSGSEDGDVSLSLSSFTSVFADQDAGDSLQALRIGSLPQNAQLLLNGAAVSVGDVVAAGDIGGLVIRPDADFSGDLSFDVALGDGTVFADTPTAVTVSIAAVNDAPVDIDDTAALTVSEAADPGDSVGTIVVSDPDAGDTHTFELVDDAGGLFSIDAVTGEVSVAGALDFETASSHQITIKGTDSGGLSNQWTRTVTVTDVNEAPVATGGISLTGVEDTDVLLSAASFNAVFSDPDAGDNLQSVRIDTLPGSGTLLLNGSVLGVGAVVSADDLDSLVLRPDADFSGNFDFNVSVGDGTLFAETQSTVSVSVTAVNDAPTALDLVLADLDIEAAVGTTAGMVTVADPDSNDSHQFSLVDDAGGAFAINQTTGEITVNAALTDEAAPYSITIQVVDSGGEQFTVTREIAIESDETFVATAAAESLDGKSGIDTIDFSASLAAVAVDLEAGTGSGGFASGDTYVNFENVIGSTFADTLTGDAGSNVLSGGAGADVLDGGAGDDTADYRSSGEGVTVDLDAGTGAGGDAQGDTLTNIENVSGSAFDDRLTGDAGENWLSGGAGADSLAGGGGNDLYHFGVGDGSDTVSDTATQEGTETVSEAYTAYRTAYRTVTVSSGEGATTTQRIAYQQAYTAYRDVDVTTIVAADGGQDAILFGENITRSDILVRLDGADLLVGIKDATQPGADIAGLSDTIRITDWTDDYSRVESVSFADGESVALSALYDNGVLVDGATVDLGVVDENSLVLLGSDADDTLEGQIGNDILTGLGGNDILQGAGGDDLVDGGEGSDIAVFDGTEAGYEITYNDDGSLTVTDTDVSDGDDGGDTLTGIETLRFGDGDVDVNDAPVDIDTTPVLSVSEAAAVGAVVGTIIVSDPDAGDTHTFEMLDDAGGLFSIDAATGAVSIAGALDFETAASHEIVVRATDSGGLSNTWTRTITVSDANETPVDIDDTAALTVSEAAGVGDSVGTIVVSDPDAGDSHTFELVDDAGGLFSIDAATGDVSIAGSLDFETATSHDIVVRATDSGGISNTWTRTVTVTNANEAPETTSGINVSGVEDNDVALTVASFAGVFSDPDEGDTLQSVRIDSLPAGGTLLLNGVALGLGSVVAAVDLDGVVYRPAENANGAVSFAVSVGDGAVFAETPTTVSIDLAAVNDAPTAIVLSNDAVDGDAVAGSEVGVVSVDDPDIGDSHVFELVDDAGGLFAIDADTGLITTTGPLDDAASPYSISIRVEDAAGLSITQTRAIAVDSDETVVATAAAEAHDGGSGIDTIDYSASLAAVSVDLDAGTGSGGFAAGDTLVNFENITGSAFADDLTGDAGSNVLSGGAGADALDGGAGVDTADYSTSANGVTVDLDAGTGSGGDAQGDTLSNIENVTGSALDDRLWGDDASNHLTGGAGADTLGGGAGADVYHFGVGDGQDEVYDYASHDESRTETEAYTAYRTAYRTITVSSGEGTTTQRVAYQQAYTAYRDVEYTDIVQDDAGLDRVVFGDGVTSSDILLQLDGADLLVGIKDAASPTQLIGDLEDVIRITDWTDTATRVETLAFQNGDEVSLTDLYDSGDITENSTFDLDSASDSSEAFGLTGLTESGLHDGTNRWMSEPIDTDPATTIISDLAYDMPVTPVDEASGGSAFTAYYSYEIQVESAPEEGAAPATDAALEPSVIPDVAPAVAGPEIDASVQQLVSAMANWAVPNGLADQEDTTSASQDQTLLDQLTVNSS